LKLFKIISKTNRKIVSTTPNSCVAVAIFWMQPVKKGLLVSTHRHHHHWIMVTNQINRPARFNHLHCLLHRSRNLSPSVWHFLNHY